jgi:hypothetical protein
MYTEDESEILRAMYEAVMDWRVSPPEDGTEKYVISTSGGDLYMTYHVEGNGPNVLVEIRNEGQPNEAV